jgi:hypothetical protein
MKNGITRDVVGGVRPGSDSDSMAMTELMEILFSKISTSL